MMFTWNRALSARLKTSCAPLTVAAAFTAMLAAVTVGSAAAAEPAKAPAPSAAEASQASGTLKRADADERLVLEKLQALGAKGVHELSVKQARSQPTPADAVKAVLKDQGQGTDPAPVAATKDITIPGPGGDIKARVYTPFGDGPFPVVLYFHGGGWVIADIDTYDGSARAIARGAKAIVVSAHYRQAPEHKFPAAHEDAIAAYKWMVENAGSLNGDTKRIAVAGESAGGNLAANVAIAARDQKLQTPAAEILIYPVAGTNTSTPSYDKNAEAMPLGKADMEWFFDKTQSGPGDKKNPMLDLVHADLHGLPPTTIITDSIDPLMSEGEMLADNMKKAGVKVTYKNFEGVTHEFFGMTPVVSKSADSQMLVGDQLQQAFGE
ncbi:Acetyl esterase/lipase [Faunimonas pinastri]|uniref:Acetyl esterase/lipase n=1 Tax=Faunimonas pinastri TaxID=1855383 RepID=A0A1H9JGD3_9HYPH|nr:alpha/beta hydrolase [Faunimonas pinastri]SEQ85853.1 Acetyl esterase/lipase [Faunimonas pinastri]